MLKALPEETVLLAELGRTTAEIRRLPARIPARSTKIGRNAPCPCGSGKKYKLCCGASK